MNKMLRLGLIGLTVIPRAILSKAVEPDPLSSAPGGTQNHFGVLSGPSGLQSRCTHFANQGLSLAAMQEHWELQQVLHDSEAPTLILPQE